MKWKKGAILFGFKSIQTTLSLSFFLLLGFSMLVSFLVSLNYTQKSVLNNSTDYTSQLIKQVNRNIDYYISYMENTADMIANSADVKNYLFQEDQSEELRDSQYSRILGQFQTIMNSRQDISNVAVVADNGKTIINRGATRLNPYITLSEQPWYIDAKESKVGYVLSTSHIQNAIADKYDWVVTLSGGLKVEEEKTRGVFFIDLNYNTINDLCDSVSLGEKGYIYVVDKAGEIIYHPQQQLLYSGLKTEELHKVLTSKKSFIKGTGEEKKVYTMATSQKTGWTVVGVSYMSELMKEKRGTQFAYMFVCGILLCVAILLANVLSKAITRPIKSLDYSMSKLKNGEFHTMNLEKFHDNEIGRLGNSFNRMTKEISMLMEQNVKEQTEKRKAEMRALQAQINPHFLYNTLDSIIWMAEGGKHNEEVVLMTSSLSKLLRSSIGNEAELVTIAQELEYTKTYLTIQRIRYRDKLEFDIQVNGDIIQEKIVKLTLQPLVENAIYHGIKYAQGKGLLRISGCAQGDRIVLKVMDNGDGMEAETLQHILEKKVRKEDANGVGVYNVQNRLQLYYGKGFGLHYESKKGEGTTVTVSIPKQEDDYDKA